MTNKKETLTISTRKKTSKDNKPRPQNKNEQAALFEEL